MAARRTRFNPESVRQKIKADRLVRRMQQHIDGKITLTMAQVRAIDILLRKIIPDLTQTSVAAELKHTYVVEVPPLLTRDEWSKKYRVAQKPEPPTIDLDPLPLLPDLNKPQ